MKKLVSDKNAYNFLSDHCTCVCDLSKAGALLILLGTAEIWKKYIFYFPKYFYCLIGMSDEFFAIQWYLRVCVLFFFNLLSLIP